MVPWEVKDDSMESNRWPIGVGRYPHGRSMGGSRWSLGMWQMVPCMWQMVPWGLMAEGPMGDDR